MDPEADHQPFRGEEREDQPLLRPPEEQNGSWKAPRGFIWVQLAIMSNVFLCAFDGTITASTYAIIGSEFDVANTASWLTTSYLLTSTAVLPLYSRVSDIFGRRICFFVSTTAFALGCFGCGAAQDIVTLNCMRAVAGAGGGGLMTMATIINSDMIPFRRRSMYQAMQNGIFGLGAISGASFGGAIADHIGWRWCFLFQVPLSVLALVIGFLAVKNQPGLNTSGGIAVLWKRVDFVGALVLVVAISTQLVGLSLGGNELPWSSPWVISSLLSSVVLFGLFFFIEARTTAVPIIPLRMLKGTLPIATQISNVCAGMAAYGFLFMIPLFFQVILLESASKAGARLVIPSLGTPTGAMIAGIVMSRWGRLIPMIRLGAFLMVCGNSLMLTLAFKDANWKYYAFLVPASLGQGFMYPSILFTSLASFEHSDHAVSASTVYLIRSLGMVWGVSLTSAILQTTLRIRLTDALSGVPDKFRIIDEIRHSVGSIRHLPVDIQLVTRHVYFDGLRHSFMALTGISTVALIAAFVASPARMRSTY